MEDPAIYSHENFSYLHLLSDPSDNTICQSLDNKGKFIMEQFCKVILPALIYNSLSSRFLITEKSNLLEYNIWKHNVCLHPLYDGHLQCSANEVGAYPYGSGLHVFLWYTTVIVNKSWIYILSENKTCLISLKNPPNLLFARKLMHAL